MSRRRCLFSSKLEAISGETSYVGEIDLTTYGYSGGSQTITIFSNRNWELDQTNLSSWSDWVTLSVTAGTKGKTQLTITVSNNSETAEREAEIVLRTTNRSKSLTISLLQNYHSTSLYLRAPLTFMSEQRIDVDYAATVTNGGVQTTSSGHVVVMGWAYPGTFIGNYTPGTVFSYSASSPGYHDEMRSFNVYDEEIISHMISLEDDTTNDFFEILNVFYSGSPTGYDPGMVEDVWLPEETFFTTSGVPLRAALVQVVKEEAPLIEGGDYWRAREPKMLFMTNIPPNEIGVSGAYISGGTDWLNTFPSAGTWSLALSAEYRGPAGPYSSFTLDIDTAAGLAYYKSSGETVHVANIYFHNERLNDKLIGVLPVVCETTQDDVMHIYQHGSQTPAEDGELVLGAYAASGYCSVDLETSRIAKIYPPQMDYSIFDPLEIYDTAKENRISKVYPTVISGTNGTIKFGQNGKYNLNVWYPANHSFSEGKTYGAYFQMENFNRQVQDGICAYLYITQSAVTYLDTDFFVSGVSVTYNGVGYGQSAITIPSSAVTYETNGFKNLLVNADIRCHRYATDWSLSNTAYQYTDYIVSSGNGVAVDANKMEIDLADWMWLANGTGSTDSDYTPIAGMPYAINTTANQTTANTGNARTGNVTVKWHWGDLKSGAASAKTVAITQEWAKSPGRLAVWIYSVSGTSQAAGTTGVSFNLARNQSITMELSGASGTVLSFGGYAGDLRIRANLTTVIGNKTLSESDYNYTATTNGLITVQITDKGVSSEGYVCAMNVGVIPPSGQGYTAQNLIITVTQ